ncbi:MULTISPECIES: CaiB/BaiF CoA transferase family protein [Rhodobacterales]|jgi:alpha-methylacyl-CoA racemase|uniref:Alpha-methylacyl-CoA racemase n=3 Tax=Roseobacteraceae TaxID=2854170 RepID=A0A521FQJ9_9RHOB|nr:MULTISPECIES: CaiB/BaiF CoA-transferase family protein [Roseobacteraceae]APE45884.1 carnitine dehydratase [Sulfitobacter alexandrii]MBV7381140.1 CoA transferase [Maritimibacter dapengensis]OWV51228.1 CoA transferase [Mameliella alba]SMO98462.1 alpha-methylacyl-CoA racemase [Thalassovita litoralis]
MQLRSGPLKGVRVVEMAGLGPAPFSAMHLADLGAEVVRVARPGQKYPFPIKEKFNIYDRSRRSVVLDLQTDDGQAALWQLLERAEILIEGFRPGVMEKLGFGPDEVLGRSPALVYGRMTGWGQTGPLAQAAGHDLNYAALSGAIWSVGDADAPPTVPLNVVGDLAGGAMMLSVGVLAALTHARATGQGQVVDTAMTDGSALMMAMQYGFLSAGFWNDNERGSNFLNGGMAWYGCYETLDRQYVALGCLEPQFYAEFLERMGLTNDPVFKDQYTSTTQTLKKERLTEVFASKTRDEWCAILEGTDACFAPVLSMSEAPDHPQNKARCTFVDVDGVIQPAPAPRFSRTPAAPPTAAGAREMTVTEILSYWSVAS